MDIFAGCGGDPDTLILFSGALSAPGICRFARRDSSWLFSRRSRSPRDCRKKTAVLPFTAPNALMRSLRCWLNSSALM